MKKIEKFVKFLSPFIITMIGAFTVISIPESQPNYLITLLICLVVLVQGLMWISLEGLVIKISDKMDAKEEAKKSP